MHPFDLVKYYLEEEDGYRSLRELAFAGRGPLILRTSQRLVPMLLSSLARDLGRPLIAIAPGVERGENLFMELETLYPQESIFYFPAREAPLEGFEVVDKEGNALRAKVLHHLARKGEGEGQRTQPPIFLLPASAVETLLHGGPGVPPPLVFRVGYEAVLDRVVDTLAAFGYRREYLVEGKGEFSLRGGIVDVYDPTHSLPFRVEFDGDRVERVRFFNPISQRSEIEAEEASIYPIVYEQPSPARNGYREKKRVPWVRDGDLVVLVEPRSAREKLRNRPEGENLVRMYDCLGNGKRAVIIDPWAPEAMVEISCREVGTYRGNLQLFLQDVKHWNDVGYHTLVLFASEGKRERIKEVLLEEGLAVEESPSPRHRGISLGLGRLRGGFILYQSRLAVVSEEDLFNPLSLRRWERETTSGVPMEGWWDLEEGDYVVHIHHGIGVFSGLTVREVSGAQREYLVLRYADGDLLYVPTERIGLVHRYVGAEKPNLHRLSGGQWRRTKRKARASIRDVAAELLQLYAERKAVEGFAFSPDTPWQKELEDSFPYLETPDQLKAIAEVKEDMEKPVPMDRLVYGDVGFGKTEVALRAAFKAVMDGKQVAVLVPTTVLAKQHYCTFQQRYAPWPVRVEMLSRFQTREQQREVLEGLSSGTVDVVIGTHRLLQEDVTFHDLGLLIVDEEHRFGVMHKERLKRLRRQVDVLTLTATPIPRTLQMALSGLRDMSTIDTPIEDRFAVVTTVSVFDERLVREAILRELQREGQVFYVYNRVERIGRVAEEVRKLVPSARVGIGHGQMQDRELERVMRDFVEGRLDVLVCTTIVESGLDIPNANTLIVDGAEQLGLSQLYHLRGRIGRSHRQAYAFFLFREGSRLTEGAFQRLQVIRDFSELGSGLRIALRDLEIRGAGNLLGPEQHGHVEALGFELYCRMLTEAVEALQGKKRRHRPLVTIDLPVRALIPPDYIERSARRMEVYRRIVEATEEEELEGLLSEVRDRYGPPPAPVINLFRLAQLRKLCEELGIREITASGSRVTFRLRRDAEKFYQQLLEVKGQAWDGLKARLNRSLGEVELSSAADFWRGEGALVEMLETLGEMSLVASATGHH